MYVMYMLILINEYSTLIFHTIIWSEYYQYIMLRKYINVCNSNHKDIVQIKKSRYHHEDY